MSNNQPYIEKSSIGEEQHQIHAPMNKYDTVLYTPVASGITKEGSSASPHPLPIIGCSSIHFNFVSLLALVESDQGAGDPSLDLRLFKIHIHRPCLYK